MPRAQTVRPVSASYGLLTAQALLFAATLSFAFAAPSAGALAADKDTIQGYTASEYRNDAPQWTTERYVRIRNAGMVPVRIDSVAHPPLKVRDGSFTSYMSWHLSFRTYGMKPATRTTNGELRVDLSPGDSVDVGLVALGIATVAKRSAVPTYNLGDTLTVPIFFHYGADSLRIMLKTRVVNSIEGVPVRAPVPGLAQAARTRMVLADGSDAGAGAEVRVRYGVPVSQAAPPLR